jgi:hypothetical protein
MTSCSIIGCDSKVHAKGLCSKHYWKQRYSSDADKKKEYQKTHYVENRDAILARTTQYGLEHKEQRKIISRRYYLLHKDEIKQKKRAGNKIRRATNPAYRLRCIVSLAVWKMLNSNDVSKNGKSVLQFLDYSMKELREYLKNQFEPWMTWDNYGRYDPKTWNDNDPSTWTWNIDHIVPQSKLPYYSMSDSNFKKCWALSNLRPFSAKQNFLDNDRK